MSTISVHTRVQGPGREVAYFGANIAVEELQWKNCFLGSGFIRLKRLGLRVYGLDIVLSCTQPMSSRLATVGIRFEFSKRLFWVDIGVLLVI